MIINRYIKKAIVYTLLCIYSFALIKPVMPIANDIIAHTFYKMEHLATVHFENGKYHVHQELAANSDQKDNSKGTAPSSIYETLSSHICTTSFEFKTYPLSSLKTTLPETQQPADVFIQGPTPPPKS